MTFRPLRAGVAFVLAFLRKCHSCQEPIIRPAPRASVPLAASPRPHQCAEKIPDPTRERSHSAPRVKSHPQILHTLTSTPPHPPHTFR
jgi:hypothetical protein